MTRILFIVILFTAACKGYSQQEYRVVLNCAKKEIKEWKDLELEVKMTSLEDTGLNVPERVWISGTSYPVGDVCMETEMYTKYGFKKFKVTSNIDYFGTEQELYKLPKNKELTANYNLNEYYNFKRGKYRTRVIYHASKFNQNMEDKYSNWIYFSVIIDRINSTRREQ